MTHIEIAKLIVKQGNCEGIYCCHCPLGLGDWCCATHGQAREAKKFIEENDMEIIEGHGDNYVVNKATARKQRPVYSGVLKYFPLAIMEVAHASWAGSNQHHPGEPIHWDKDKSSDELDALVRHLCQADEKDDDGVWHMAKVAWRAMAYLERKLEADNAGL